MTDRLQHDVHEDERDDSDTRDSAAVVGAMAVPPLTTFDESAKVPPPTAVRSPTAPYRMLYIRRNVRITVPRQRSLGSMEVASV
jgi:hypothetical protein